MNLIDLEQSIVEWSAARGILTNGKAETQCLKLMSELGELADNLAKGRDVKDDIGDCFVVLTNIARLCNTTLEECVNLAYNEIKDRQGFLNANGSFIKSTDANYDKLYAEFLENTKIETAKMLVELKEIEELEFIQRMEEMGFSVTKTAKGFVGRRIRK